MRFRQCRAQDVRAIMFSSRKCAPLRDGGRKLLANFVHRIARYPGGHWNHRRPIASRPVARDPRPGWGRARSNLARCRAASIPPSQRAADPTRPSGDQHCLRARRQPALMRKNEAPPTSSPFPRRALINLQLILVECGGPLRDGAFRKAEVDPEKKAQKNDRPAVQSKCSRKRPGSRRRRDFPRPRGTL